MISKALSIVCSLMCASALICILTLTNSQGLAETTLSGTLALDEPDKLLVATYEKKEVRIPMRDGVTLYTVIYTPKDISNEKKYPILFQRTPYGCWPYGEAMPDRVMYNPKFVRAGYIFVYQDLRSRTMSDGEPNFENLKPAYSLKDPNKPDEITDAKDSIDWLLANVDHNNGNVGMFGSSYMGYTALMGGVSAHPNLKAVVAGAPSVNIYFEDFNRNGLFTLAYTPILDWFGTPKLERHEGPWWENNLDYWVDGKRFGLAKDSYDFFLKKGALSNFAGDLIPEENYFWKTICEHPDYDEYRQERNALQYLRGIQCPVLIVGGWNDEQNMYGIINSYHTVNGENPDCDCNIVVGPWTHSEHKRRNGQTVVGDVNYGDGHVENYQDQIEYSFFASHLKGEPAPWISEAMLFDTGVKEWHQLQQYFDENRETQEFYFDSKESLSTNKPGSEQFFEFVSDPAKPVPYVEDDQFHLSPSKEFMTADQRFASKRPDVLTFSSAPLESDLRIAGPLNANLIFSTDQGDADLFVKLIDVYPMDRAPEESDPKGKKMNGYQQMVRCGQIRGRYRESYSKPKPFEPNVPTEVRVELLDVCHTFKRGHRIMVQVQSSLFPLFDRNPQKYVDNIYCAKDTDFTKATHRIHAGSRLSFQLLNETDKNANDKVPTQRLDAPRSGQDDKK